jgi:hypothetical protein
MLVLASMSIGAAARADEDSDHRIAQQLFDDGRALLEAGRYAEACPKFAESQRLDPGGGTLLNLALCHELEGKSATAWSEFHDGLGLAMKDDRKDREDLARKHIAELAPRLVRVVVHVPGRLAGRAPEIALDQSRLPQAAWETSIPVDPGEHRVVVTLKNAEPWSTSVVATEPGKTYEVSLPAFDLPIVCPANEIRVDDACVPIPWDAGKPKRTTAFWVVLGTGGALLATSAITGIVALDANAYVKNHCSDARDFCTVSDAHATATRATTFAWLSTGTLVAGLGAAGIAFLLPRETSTRPTLRVGLGTLTIDGL